MGGSVMAERSFSSVRAALVGRDVELERAHAALDGVIGGDGRLLLISGEPGIGKTRLAEELGALAVDQGALVAWGRVDDVEGAPPYWPWVQVLEGILERGDRDGLGALLGDSAGPIAAVVPAIAEFVGEIEMPPVLDPAAGRFRLHAAIVDLLRGLGAHRPLVVVLDDMHWADVSSLELARFVAARLNGAQVLVVVTYRDVDGGSSPAFDDVLASLARLPGLERIALTGLSEREVGRFMAQTLGLRPRAAMAASVHARTEGNPFFVGEVARLLQSEGLLGAPRPPGEPTVPVGVRDVVRRRLVRLPEQTNELLVLPTLNRSVSVSRRSGSLRWTGSRTRKLPPHPSHRRQGPPLRRTHESPVLAVGNFMATSGERTWPPVGRTDGRTWGKLDGH